MSRPTRRWGALAMLLLAACGVDHGVTTQRADRSAATTDATVTSPTTPPSEPTDPTDPTETSAPSDTSVPSSDPPPTTGTTDDPGGTVAPNDLLDFGDDKPPRDYDEFLTAALTDIEQWWSEQYPLLYGAPFEPLQGGIYAGYPERTAPIPGCGPDAETTYDELQLFAAFYCPEGDFMAYDDGESGVLYALTSEFGASILGVVLAHEYGHAIQARSGVLATEPPTIVTEQQADCFSGAWVARAAAGEATGIEFSDEDIRSGLISIITVRDPIGVDQFEPGGHGSAFDRVGAFQVGFTDGPQRCVGLVDEPLPLMPNVFTQNSLDVDGNADFGYDDGQVVNFTANDLNEFWVAALAGSGAEAFGALEVVPFEDPGSIECDDELVGNAEVGALFCPSTRVVHLDEPLALSRYRDFGDFAVSYMLGSAWSEAAQASLGSPLDAEERALLSDCFTGAWAQTLVPDEGGNPVSTTGVFIEPGDLDEAIQTALAVGDNSSSEDVLGSPFEKIASFRAGVLGSVDACRDLLPN